MIQNELITLLRSFSLIETRKLKEFLNSPYFNKSRKVIKLYEALLKYYPSFSARGFTKESIHTEVAGAKRYNDSTFRSLMHDLLILAEEFLILESISSEDPLRRDHLLKALSRKKQDDLFIKNLQKINSAQQRAGKIDSAYFINRYMLETHYVNYNLLNKPILNNKALASYESALDERNMNFLSYVISELISNYYNTNFLNDNFNFKDSTRHINEIIKYIDIEGLIINEFANYKYAFFIELYYKLHRCYRNFDSMDAYESYKTAFLRYKNRLTKDELSFHFFKLVNFCLTKIKAAGEAAKHDFNEELFGLYSTGLKHRFYLNSKVDHIPADLFRNILLLGLRLEKFDWVKVFIKKYSKLAHPAFRDSLHNFGFAYFYNSTGEYERSLQFLISIKIDYFIFKIDIKNLTLINFYKTGSFEEALYLIQSYRKFLKHNHLVASNSRIRYMNFINFMEKIILYRLGNRDIDILYMEYRLNKIQNIAFKKLLLELLKELK